MKTRRKTIQHSAVIAGLVAITPASGFVSPLGGICIGAIASAVCFGMVALRSRGPDFLQFNRSC